LRIKGFIHWVKILFLTSKHDLFRSPIYTQPSDFFFKPKNANPMESNHNLTKTFIHWAKISFPTSKRDLFRSPIYTQPSKKSIPLNQIVTLSLKRETARVSSTNKIRLKMNFARARSGNSRKFLRVKIRLERARRDCAYLN
jgi:hypothetical protein